MSGTDPRKEPISIPVQLGKRSYPVIIKAHIIVQAGFLIRKYSQCTRGGIISDRTVYQMYGPRLRNSLLAAGIHLAEPFLIQPGERSKTHSTLLRCYHHLADQSIDRKSCLFILGGGVPGDLGGYAAATYMRGIECVQIPTSLLAQADASVGGKTAVNLGEAKNLVGAFHQPQLVICDTAALATLPDRHFRNGLAEVIKAAVIGDPALFQRLENLGRVIPDFEDGAMDSILSAAIHVKSRIVKADEREKGIRANLNLGHTVGHAIESALGYRQFLHGEAVALGMIAASEISRRLGVMPEKDHARLLHLIEKVNLPVTVRGLSVDEIVTRLRWDKKNSDRGLNWVLPMRIGEVDRCHSIPPAIIRAGIQRILSA